MGLLKTEQRHREEWMRGEGDSEDRKGVVSIESK